MKDKRRRQEEMRQMIQNCNATKTGKNERQKTLRECERKPQEKIEA